MADVDGKHTSGDSSASITAPLVFTRIALGVGSDGARRGAYMVGSWSGSGRSSPKIYDRGCGLSIMSRTGKWYDSGS